MSSNLTEQHTKERPSNESLRTFVCIEIPESVKARIGELQQALKSSGGQVSWTRPANIHLTLKFLGDVEASRIESVKSAAAQVASCFEPFKIEVGGAGCFPSPRSPRVLWVGLKSLPEPLRRLQAALEDELARAGFAREQKKFSPHLTIARIRGSENTKQLAEKLISNGFEAESFQAREIIVMRSELSPKGSIYTPQAVMRLG